MRLLVLCRNLSAFIAAFAFAVTSAVAQGQTQSQDQSTKQGQKQTQSQTQQQQKDDKGKVELVELHNQGFPLDVTDAEVIQVGKALQAAEVVDIRVEVTYGNSCQVAETDQIVELRMESDTTIDIQLLEFFDKRNGPKICPLIYSPVTVDYVIEDVQIGVDGEFKELIINGMSVN